MRKPNSTTSDIRKLRAVRRKRNALSEVQAAAESFAELCQGYNEAADGYRLRLYKFAARCYWIGRTFARNPGWHQKFMSDEFWSGVRQKPKDDEIMKAVLTFAMSAKSQNLRNRVTKTAAVLESFEWQELRAEHVVVARLKAGGGIEKMCREISGTHKGGSALPDDLDLLKPAQPEDDKDQAGEADQEKTEKSDEGSDEVRGDSPLSAKEASERVALLITLSALLAGHSIRLACQQAAREMRFHIPMIRPGHSANLDPIKNDGSPES